MGIGRNRRQPKDGFPTPAKWYHTVSAGYRSSPANPARPQTTRPRSTAGQAGADTRAKVANQQLDRAIQVRHVVVQVGEIDTPAAHLDSVEHGHGRCRLLAMQVRVDLGRRDVGVSQQLLYGTQVRALAEHFIGKRVAQGVRGDVL